MNFYTNISKINSLDFWMVATAFHQKPFANLKWTAVSSN